MRAWTNFLRGNVTLRITGPFPERFLNLCGANGIPFWHLRRENEEALRLHIPRSRLKEARALAEQAHCREETEEYRGLPDFLLRFRRRYGFLAGLFLAVLAAAALSRVVLVIDVTGNETVPTSVILGELQNAGLRIGSFGPRITARDIAHRVLLQDQRLSYVAVNLHGIRAEVIVRESDLPPDILDTETPCDLVAGADGVITRVEVWSGVGQVETGDVVAKGDTLVTGEVVYTHPETGEVLYAGQVGSAGEIWARTWRSLTASVPLSREGKRYTGAETRQSRVILFGYTFKFYENSRISYHRYDKITSIKQLVLPGGIALPIYWEQDVCREYTTAETAVRRDEAESAVKALLIQRLKGSLGERDSITGLEFEAAEQDGWLNVTLNAECCQEIGVQAALSTEGND